MQYLNLIFKPITVALLILSLCCCQHFSFYKSKSSKLDKSQPVVMDGDGGNLMRVVTEGNVEMVYPTPWNQDIDTYGKYLCKTIDIWLRQHPFVDFISIPYPCNGSTISIYLSKPDILKMELFIPHNNFNINEIIESLDEFYRYYAANDIRNNISEYVLSFKYIVEDKTWVGW